MNFEETNVQMSPGRDVQTYVRMVGFAVGMRLKNESMSPDFRMCIPFKFLPELALKFPAYQYSVLGFCFTRQTDCFVLFRPVFTHA